MTSTEITYAVLAFCARKSTTTIQDLCAEFPHIGNSRLETVVGEMAEARLIRATANRSDLLDGTVWFISPIDGLTFIGEEWLDRFSPVEDDSGRLH